MIRIIRTAGWFAVVLDVFWAILLLKDWANGEGSPLETSGFWFGVVPYILLGLLVLLVLVCIAIHRTKELIEAMGLEASHDRKINEAEARGEAPN